METGTIVSLAAYFILMLVIGLWAWRKSTDDVSGYLLGGRQLSPSVAALSAGASDMSGWLMLGLPGAAFVSGLSAGWIAIGLFVGALLNYLIVAPRLRVHTERTGDSITIPQFFEERFRDDSHALRIVSALVIIIFFTLYTSAGMVSGGKLFESAFGANYALGLWLTAGVVVAYTLFGGFLAVSLTDFVQGIIMFVALILLPVVAFTQLDGQSATSLAAATPAVRSARHRLPARGAARRDHEHHLLAASGLVQFADRGLLPHLPSPERQPEGTGTGRAPVGAGGGAGRDPARL
jgi:sodium/proline symporter